MIIYGAGLAGLLAANMLRRHDPVILEAQSSLPNNHDALLRFRTDAVSRVTGIPFKKVRVSKAICYLGGILTEPNLRLSNMYARKVTGEVIERSILNLEPSERYIAPLNLIAQMARSCKILYDSPLTQLEKVDKQPVVSTIPMPTLMKLAKWKPQPSFNFRDITSITAFIVSPPIEVYQTLYYPGSEPFYRASITGDRLIIEAAGDMSQCPDPEQLCMQVLGDFGIYSAVVMDVEMKEQRYGKIAPIANNIRKQFILAMSDLYNIYSVGRFATWRQILLDDVVNDVNLVEQFISQRDSYTHRLKGISANA